MMSMIKENPKAFYRYVKKKRLTRENVGLLKDKGGIECLQLEDVGEIAQRSWGLSSGMIVFEY